jgi:hypothetical protein
MSGSEEEGTLNTLSSKNRKSTARMSEVMKKQRVMTQGKTVSVSDLNALKLLFPSTIET